MGLLLRLRTYVNQVKEPIKPAMPLSRRQWSSFFASHACSRQHSAAV